MCRRTAQRRSWRPLSAVRWWTPPRPSPAAPIFTPLPTGSCCSIAARVDRFNRIDEAVTLATLPEYAVVQAWQMVATVKIIPFAIPAELLGRCQAALAEGPLLRVAPFRSWRARLIQTELPSVPPKVLDKTVRITRDRVAVVQGELVGEARCAHTVAAVTVAVRDALAAGCDMVLIAGASAITDRHDVLPAGIDAAGGIVEHFGMPVDPGNLLLLGRLDGHVVLGLPGCCRSPKLNGLDWVLQRLAAGIPVAGREIMGMGVGGLLSEIPSRPQPREANTRPAPAGVAALVLAGGQSRRMGGPNKLLVEVAGKAMVRHVVEAALASRADPVVVVVGHQQHEVRQALRGLKVRFAHNPEFAEGLSTSLRAGLAALPAEASGAVVCLGDMPGVSAELIDRLIAAFDPVEGRTIVMPTRHGKRGNPGPLGPHLLPRDAGGVGRCRCPSSDRRACRRGGRDRGRQRRPLLDIDTPRPWPPTPRPRHDLAAPRIPDLCRPGRHRSTIWTTPPPARSAAPRPRRCGISRPPPAPTSSAGVYRLADEATAAFHKARTEVAAYIGAARPTRWCSPRAAPGDQHRGPRLGLAPATR